MIVVLGGINLSLFLMNLKVKKRDGTVVPFKKEKICTAIGKAYIEDCTTGFGKYEQEQINEITDKVCETLRANLNLPVVDVEQIRETIEYELMNVNPAVAKVFITFKYKEDSV